MGLSRAAGPRAEMKSRSASRRMSTAGARKQAHRDKDPCGAIFPGGPVALAYSRFSDEQRANVHNAYLESLAQYRAGGGYRVPGEFMFMLAVKE